MDEESLQQERLKKEHLDGERTEKECLIQEQEDQTKAEAASVADAVVEIEHIGTK